MSAATARSLPDRGLLALPTDAAWESSRGAYNTLIDQRPAAIGLPRDEREVATLIKFAAERGVRVAAQGAAHNAGPLGPLRETILLNTSKLQSFSIDPTAERVRVGAGVKWNAVVPRLSELGLAALHGSSPDVGIVGYSLGGGIGWLGRRHGLQCNSVTAIDLVTADGELLTADRGREPELFWALRGGGGSFGAVTAIEFSVYPVASVHAGGLFFPFEQAAEVLRTWSSLIGKLPDEVTTWANLMHLPDLPTVPEELRGRSFTVVLGACLGSESDAREALAPLRQHGPVMDTFADVRPRVLADLAMDPPEPVPYRSVHAVLERLPETMIDEIVTAAGPRSGLLLVQLRHLCGALSRSPQGAGARAGLDGEVAMFALGMVLDDAMEDHLRGSLRALEHACTATALSAHPSFVETPADASAFYDEDTWLRLREVKSIYDPGDLFRGNHHVPPLTNGAPTSGLGATSSVPTRR